MDKIFKHPNRGLDYLIANLVRTYSEEYKKSFSVTIGDDFDYTIVSKDGHERIYATLAPVIHKKQFAVEYFDMNLMQPMGILATEANLFVYIVDMPGKILVLEFEINLLRTITVGFGEMAKTSEGVLVKFIPFDIVKKFAQRIFQIDGESYQYEILSLEKYLEAIPSVASKKKRKKISSAKVTNIKKVVPKGSTKPSLKKMKGGA